MDDEITPITLRSRSERSHIEALDRQVRRARIADAIAYSVLVCTIAIAAWSLLWAM